MLCRRTGQGLDLASDKGRVSIQHSFTIRGYIAQGFSKVGEMGHGQ